MDFRARRKRSSELVYMEAFKILDNDIIPSAASDDNLTRFF